MPIRHGELIRLVMHGDKVVDVGRSGSREGRDRVLDFDVLPCSSAAQKSAREALEVAPVR